MTPFVARSTATILACVACLLAVLGLAACSPAPAASTLVPTSATAGPSLEPSATRTASPVPASATASPEPPTATARATATPSRTRAASATPTERESAAAATATQTVAPAASPSGSGDFTPTQAQVWNTAVVGGDNTGGTCTATANAPYGLVLLTPGDGTLAMHNTVPEDYVLTRLGDNAYQFSGAAALGDGALTLDVRFTSATTLTMSRIFVSNAEPGCTHQHNYTGTFRNNR